MSEREIAPQESSLGRSRGALDESCQDSKREQAIPLNKDDEHNEQQKSQRLHQMRDTPEQIVANSAKNDRQQSESYDKKRDGHEGSFQDRRDQEKEAVPRRPVSASGYHHHTDLQLKGSVPNILSRGDKHINQARIDLQENIRGDQAIKSKEAPPPTKSIFSTFADRFKSKANLGSFEKDDAQEGATTRSTSTIDQPCDTLGQLPKPLVVKETPEIFLCIILNYAVFWLRLLWMLPRCTQPILAYVTAGTYIVTEASAIYLRISEFWFIEGPELYIGALLILSFVRNLSLIIMTTHYGLACATTLVWLIPELNNVMQRISWIWRCTGTKEEPMDQISFRRYCRPGIAYIHGPFPYRPNKDFGSAILHSFDVKSWSWCYAVVWDMLVEVVRHVSFYVALFSGDSWPSRTMASAFAYFVASEHCPRPHVVDHARSVDDLLVRVCKDTIDSGTIRCTPFNGCLNHQPIVSRCLQAFAKKVVETLEGRPINDGGFDSLGTLAKSLFLVLSLFVPVAIILALSWNWFGPTVTVTFS